MLQSFSTLCWRLICPGNKVLWIWVCFFSFLFFSFFFFFFFFIKKFQSSLNFESSLRFFSAEFLVEFSFSWIHFQLNFLGRTSVVDFHLCLLLFLGELHSWSEWRNQSAGLSFYAFSAVPRIRTEGQTSSSWLKGGGHFLVPHCLGLLLPFPLWSNQAPLFFLRNNFFYLFIPSFLLLSLFSSLFLLVILFVLHHCLNQSRDIFLDTNAELLTKRLPFSLYT